MKGHFGIGGVTPESVLYRERVNDALVRCNGDRKMAAEIMGISEDKLKIKICTCKILYDRWGLKEEHMIAPNPIDTISRDPGTPQMDRQGVEKLIPEYTQLTSDDLALDKAMRQEDEKVRQGLRGTGMSEAEVEIAMGLYKFGERFYGPSLHIISAGATNMAVKIQVEASSIVKRLEFVRSKLNYNCEDAAYTEHREKWAREEKGLMAALVDMSNASCKQNEVGFKSAQVRAAIERHNRGTIPKKKSKPGYSPPTIVDIQ